MNYEKQQTNLSDAESPENRQGGFTYIEVIISIVILTIGILGAISAMTAAVVTAYGNEDRVQAKQIVHQTLESIFTAKDVPRPGATVGWHSIGNIGSNVDPDPGVARGIFVTGFQPVHQSAGPDGLMGTADDACGLADCVINSVVVNNSPILTDFERQIVITDIDDPERPVSSGYEIKQRQVVVTVRYRLNRLWLQESATTFVTDY